MKSHIFTRSLFLAVLCAPCLAKAAPAVTVRSVATISSSEVILDIIADTASGVDLRGFGVRISFDDTVLRLASAGSYDRIWYFTCDGSVRPYTDVRTPAAGEVTIVGGRLDCDRPTEGVGGTSVLLATLVFGRIQPDAPVFQMALANPPPFTNFATAAGVSLDGSISFSATTTAPASVDSDNDHLPDAYEIATFFKLAVSNGSSDYDHDGESDLDEYIRGTDPKDPASRSGFELVVQPDATKLLRWHGAEARVYDILWSPDLGPFQILRGGIPGANALLQEMDDLHGTESKGFYRLETHFPTAGR